MKNKIAIILALAVSTVCALAQVTNTTPPTPYPAPAATPPSFLDTAGSYFSSFNTNLVSTFAITGATTNRGSLWTGAVLQNNVNLGQEVGLSYNIAKGFSVEAAALNAGVFNTILDAEVGVGYNVIIVDTKVTLGVAGGTRFAPTQGYVAGFAMLEKALTTHTFFGLRLEMQSGGKNDLVPELTALTGFTF